MTKPYPDPSVMYTGIEPSELRRLKRSAKRIYNLPWWRHQMEAFTALLAICAGNSPITGEFPAERAMTRGFDIFFDLRLNEQLSKQSWGWWFETPSHPLWHHSSDEEKLMSTQYLFMKNIIFSIYPDILYMKHISSTCHWTVIWVKSFTSFWFAPL